ncbi:POU domain, class 6, transcription factor 2 [Neocloeon triangulifer]|uniref:POU domain, class 6, transcription factor 2 n=1 Tax=Neocloeon triangulifer TaxID=2078957 RepID=UPI00286EB918|nr:POU domain, class 6, transcription factor 2 [Neocloeon triangulifer]
MAEGAPEDEREALLMAAAAAAAAASAAAKREDNSSSSSSSVPLNLHKTEQGAQQLSAICHEVGMMEKILISDGLNNNSSSAKSTPTSCLQHAQDVESGSAASSPRHPMPAEPPCSPPLTPQVPNFAGLNGDFDAAKLAAAVAAQAHLNGTVASFANLQNLAGLQSSLANAPLNLTMGSAQHQSSSQSHQQPVSMPQLILASGQLVQGIQGAQLLIPTSQGLATQTILAIPVSQSTGSPLISSLVNSQSPLQNLTQPLQMASGAGGSSSPPLSSLGLSSQHLLNSAPSALGLPPQMLQQPLMAPSTASSNNSPSVSNQSVSRGSVSPPSHRTHPYSIPEKHPNGAMNGASMNTISRLASATGLTVTPTQSRAHSVSSHHKSSPHSAQQTQLPPHNHHTSSHQNGSLSPGALSPSALDPLNDMSHFDDIPGQPTINQATGNVVDGINLDEIKEFAKAFKLRRLSLGLTQTQVGQALSVTEGPAYSQSAICSALATQMYCTAAQIASQQQAMFEKLDITPKSAQKIKPVLERWMKEAEESNYRYKSGHNQLTEFIGVEPSKKRKRRTSFTPQALEILNVHFERNTHPSGAEITALAQQLGYEREVIRIWFCNKRQALKNTVRMMSKGVV